VPIDDRPDAPCVRLTISVGVSAIDRDADRGLTDLLAAADSALYHAKQAGRNKVAVAAVSREVPLEVTFSPGMELAEVDPAGA